MTGEYLNSFDYIAAYLADCCKDSPGGANHFVLELELSRPAELAWLTVHIRQRVGLLPHLTGQMCRKLFTLAPYWKWENGRKSRIEILQGSQEMAQDYINEPLRAETYFGVLICGSTLYFKFSHLIFALSHKMCRLKLYQAAKGLCLSVGRLALPCGEGGRA